MKARILTAFLAVFALAGCNSSRENVSGAQRELNETRQEAAQDVRDAQSEAVRDINKAKEGAAANIRDAQRDLQNTQREATSDAGSASGATTGANGASPNAITVSPEQCAQFATNRNILPDQQALYDACAKMDPGKYGR